MAQQEYPGHAPTFGATITVLFSDIRGFTEYTDQFGDEAAYRMLQHHNTQLQEQIALYGGHIVKSLGDSYMVSFEAARMAVACAVAMQRAIESYNQTQQGPKIEIGVGINTGEPVREADDLFGGAVNLASRICAASGPGRVLVSETVRHVVGRAEGVEWVDRGFYEIKGFADPQHLFEVEWSDRGAVRATPVTAPRADMTPMPAPTLSQSSSVAPAPLTPVKRGVPWIGLAVSGILVFIALVVVVVLGRNGAPGAGSEGESGAPGAFTGGKLLRADDFSDPAKGLVLNNQRGNFRQTFSNGTSAQYEWEYGYQDGGLVAKIKGPYPPNPDRAYLGWSIPLNDKLFEDFAVEFSARVTKSPGQAQYALAYVIDPNVNPPDQYSLSVQPRDRSMNIAYTSKEPRRQLTGGQNSAVKSGREENVTRMEVRGDAMRVFVNGVEAERAQHEGLARRGGILRLNFAMYGPPDDGDVEVRFDDLKIFSLAQ